MSWNQHTATTLTAKTIICSSSIFQCDSSYAQWMFSQSMWMASPWAS